MSLIAQGAGSLLINGQFLPELWTRVGEEAAIVCPIDDVTFAADRWYLRYASARGAAVSQARSEEVPKDAGAGTSLEIRGHAGVAESVYVGQRIESSEVASYRRELRFSAWCRVEHPSLRECPVRLAVRHALTCDVLDANAETLIRSAVRNVPPGVWTRLEFGCDATAARPWGLAVELELPAMFLCHPEARVRLSAATLGPAESPEPGPRSSAIETWLARRFYQRHSARNVNAIGRALVCNPHELHFQFTFPEMRAAPAVTLPQDNADLTVFSCDGIAQDGFVYDVPYSARGSVMIRATKWDHGLSDGFMAFRGYRGAILLEAEL